MVSFQFSHGKVKTLWAEAWLLREWIEPRVVLCSLWAAKEGREAAVWKESGPVLPVAAWAGGHVGRWLRGPGEGSL